MISVLGDERLSDAVDTAWLTTTSPQRRFTRHPWKYVVGRTAELFIVDQGKRCPVVP